MTSLTPHYLVRWWRRLSGNEEPLHSFSILVVGSCVMAVLVNPSQAAAIGASSAVTFQAPPIYFVNTRPELK